MTESLECVDVRKDCGCSTHADTEPDLMQQITEYLKHEHNIREIPQELIAEIEASMKDIRSN